tara:strand:- start:559 stop:1524 length:966 start_codon:yes stop_codon:yes gene_type:complete
MANKLARYEKTFKALRKKQESGKRLNDWELNQLSHAKNMLLTIPKIEADKVSKKRKQNISKHSEAYGPEVDAELKQLEAALAAWDHRVIKKGGQYRGTVENYYKGLKSRNEESKKFFTHILDNEVNTGSLFPHTTTDYTGDNVQKSTTWKSIPPSQEFHNRESDKAVDEFVRIQSATTKASTDSDKLTSGDVVIKQSTEEMQNDVSKSYFNANNIIETPLYQETGSDPFVIPYTQYEKAGKRQSQSKGSVAKNQALLKDMKNEGRIDPWSAGQGFMPEVSYSGYGNNPNLVNAWDKTVPTQIADFPVKDLPDLTDILTGSG